MKVTSVIENTSSTGLPTEHGLCLHIGMADGRQVLFDMGQGTLFADNAQRLGINVADIDIAVISHGHYDHGGGLRTFLNLNGKAKVYIHRNAFQPHYSLRESGLAYIGIDRELQDSGRLVLCGDREDICDSLTLFAAVDGTFCRPQGNRLLFGPEKTCNDTFSHEQNLIIREGGTVVLLAGCAHNGIINILRRAEEVAGVAPTHVFAGMHLVKSGLAEKEEAAFTDTLARELMKYSGTRFHTMHCTGEAQYLRMKSVMVDRLDYLSCGEHVEL